MSVIYKHRPSLSKEDIKHILHLAKCSLHSEYEHSRVDNQSKSIIKALAPFLAKIENDIISPAYASIPKQSMLESLEGVPSQARIGEALTGEAKVAYGLACYNKFKKTAYSCNLQEIEAAREHAYVNDLMNETEEAEYEAEGVQG